MPITNACQQFHSQLSKVSTTLELFPGGWCAIPAFVIDRRFASVSVESQPNLASPRGPCQLIVTFSHGTSHHRPSATTTGRRFLLSTSADDDHPKKVSACQSALAIASVLYCGCATSFYVNTERCGVMSWEAHRDGCFGTCVMSRATTTAPASTTSTADNTVGGVIQAVGLLNANIVMPQQSRQANSEAATEAQHPETPTLLLLYCTNGERGAALHRTACANTSSSSGWVRHSTSQALVDALAAYSLPPEFRNASASLFGVSPSDDSVTGTSGFELPGGAAGLVIPLAALSAPAAQSPAPLRNIVVLLNVEVRPTTSWDSATLNSALTETVQCALSRLAADNMDVFGRAMHQGQRRHRYDSTLLHVEDAGRIQCVADAVASMVVTSRGGSSASTFERNLHTILAIPHSARPQAGDKPLNAAALRFYIEELLRQQYGLS